MRAFFGGQIGENNRGELAAVVTREQIGQQKGKL